jgi:hypothetical protein
MAHQPKAPRLPIVIRAMLSGADWHWINGSKHWKLIVNGRMVGIWPKGLKGRTLDGDQRGIRNARSQIRNAMRRNVA